MRRAREMNSREPQRIDPTGAQSPLLRQNVTESTCSQSSAGARASATAALNSRAPSR